MHIGEKKFISVCTRFLLTFFSSIYNMKLQRISIAISTVALLFVTKSFAQSEGNTVRTGATISTYSCDPNVCKLANGCVCASKSPPNGLAPADTPQFVTVTFDDSIQPQLYKTAKKMLNVTYVICL
jgi:hypothetical protein